MTPDLGAEKARTNDTSQPYTSFVSTQPGAPKVWPGEIESRWVDSQPAALQPYKGRWIGILGRQVVASGMDFKAVYDQLDFSGLPDALVMRYPTDEDRKVSRV